MRECYEHGFDDVISDLKALLEEPEKDVPIHYPRPTRQWDSNHPSYEWFVGNNKRRYQEQKRREKGGRPAAEKRLPTPVALDLAGGDRGLPLIDRDGREGKE